MYFLNMEIFWYNDKAYGIDDLDTVHNVSYTPYPKYNTENMLKLDLTKLSTETLENYLKNYLLEEEYLICHLLTTEINSRK